MRPTVGPTRTSSAWAVVGRRPRRAPRPPRPGAGHRPPAHPQRALVGRAAPGPARSAARRSAAPAPCSPPTELDAIADDYVTAARLARDAGFDFVDVKACHGYLLHELLSGRRRRSAERAATMRTIIERVRAEGIRGRRAAVACSTCRPTTPGPTASASRRPTEPWGFDDPLALDRPARRRPALRHRRQPLLLPPRPAAGLDPAERRLRAARGPARRRGPPARQRRRRSPPPDPHVTVVATGFSYLQEWLPHVASAVVRDGGAALVGIGRMALSYPDLPADVLAGRDARPAAASAAPSATAPPRRATGSSPAAIPWTRCTRSTPTARCSSRPRSGPVPDADGRHRSRSSGSASGRCTCGRGAA